MIVWRGWGILVVVFLLVGFFVGQALGKGVDMPEAGASVGTLAASVAIWFLGSHLNRPVEGYDQETGQPRVYKNAHTLFFIPMQYWVVVGLVYTAANVLHAVQGS
ncbi:hypothetical protein [Nocardia huaxiensis]|uniref:hypothetical protein n=1 Tax=Nocardia huaxiensis TaxID=2755382 RepID=UPI001E47B26B|nr:hypothetical protein [Nocardia huaxiensis]UFS93411.1 hypothetical protein LPY97_21520 [Nocardia huaxiensis]